MYGSYNETDLIKDLEALEINQEKVGHFSYSNLGYGTIGWILQKATGKSYVALLQQNITGPFGLKNTSSVPDPNNLVTPYRPEWGLIQTKPWKMGLLKAGGGLFSSAEDLAHLMVQQMAVFQQEQPGKSPLYNMQAKRPSWGGGFYGYGMFENPARTDTTTQAFWHSGDIDGFASLYAFVPKYEMRIVILTSRGKRWMRPLEAKIQDRLLQLYKEDPLATRMPQ